VGQDLGEWIFDLVGLARWLRVYYGASPGGTVLEDASRKRRAPEKLWAIRQGLQGCLTSDRVAQLQHSAEMAGSRGISHAQATSLLLCGVRLRSGDPSAVWRHAASVVSVVVDPHPDGSEENVKQWQERLNAAVAKIG